MKSFATLVFLPLVYATGTGQVPLSGELSFGEREYQKVCPDGKGTGEEAATGSTVTYHCDTFPSAVDPPAVAGIRSIEDCGRVCEGTPDCGGSLWVKSDGTCWISRQQFRGGSISPGYVFMTARQQSKELEECKAEHTQCGKDLEACDSKGKECEKNLTSCKTDLVDCGKAASTYKTCAAKENGPSECASLGQVATYKNKRFRMYCGQALVPVSYAWPTLSFQECMDRCAGEDKCKAIRYIPSTKKCDLSTHDLNVVPSAPLSGDKLSAEKLHS
ncbi:hypothetical protein BDV25DRAFT_141170 [Aspergillus avenaceus]|uniref:Apple domain-containing protein n=1 Tax=Aspergillus avenaceus TaxID=36643 RepID=A0A5N6TRT3_ASPAV|nr:hypothetical protein BDV25DRAFT_141170 [Aspergillus avenaceus]